MMTPTTYEVVFKLIDDSPAGRDILRCVIISFGFDLSKLVEKEGARSFSVSIYFEDKEEARRTVETFEGLALSNITATLVVHKESDWATKWKKGWKPFPLTPRFHVVPLWQKSRKVPKGKKTIYLDTTSAFGTGLHETTRFTAQIIDSLKGRFDSFLDIGTGSGILAIVAFKLGAKKVVAFDIDPAAVDVARANLRANKCPTACAIVMDADQYSPKVPFDLVAANLVTQDLILFRDRIVPCVREGGCLVVSGISLANLPGFLKGFVAPMLRRMRVVKGKEWAAVLFQNGQKG